MVYTLQSMVDNLQQFWVSQGCIVLPAYPAEIGAATFHPATVFNCCSNKVPAMRVLYVQPCIRPADNRGSASRNRLYQHHQLQVIIKPVPSNMRELYLQSLKSIFIDVNSNDVRFIEDNWENPSIGAYGLGCEVQMNGMEVTQFTYMQQVGGINCPTMPVELAYGLERLAMMVQEKDSIYDIVWSDDGLTYGDFFRENEEQFSDSFAVETDGDFALNMRRIERSVESYLEANLPLVAYKFCLQASHALNLMDAYGVLCYSDRVYWILRIKELVHKSCVLWDRKAQ